MVERLGLRLRFFLFFALLAIGAVCAVVGLSWFVGQHLPPERVADLVLAAGIASFALVGLILWVWMLFDENVARPILTLASEVRASVHAGSDYGWRPGTGRYLGILTPTLQEMLQSLNQARQEQQQAVEAATAEAERQKHRLASILQDLQEGVLICNLQHRILLYNRRALEMLRAPENLGLGRSLLDLIKAQPLRHALERLDDRFRTGRYRQHRDGLKTRFVCPSISGHQQFRLHLALLLENQQSTPVGYVLALEDVSDELAAGIWRDRLLDDVTTDLRQRITHMSLAGELLCAAAGEAADGTHGQVLRGELQAASERLQRLEDAANDLLAGAWPMTEVFSPNLLNLARQRRSEGRDLEVEINGEPLWFHCDSGALVELLDRLLNRVAVWAGVNQLQLAAHRQDTRAYIDMRWSGQPVPQNELKRWLEERLEEGLGPVSVQDVLSRHRTDLWSQRVEGDQACLRLPLHLLEEYYDRPLKSASPAPERPEFYDFQLLEQRDFPALQDTPLRALDMVVFDTETTGLEPSRGDEIISIAGVRIVNGRVLRGEIFNSFVNPGRKIPLASTKIHGIDDDMVRDADPLATVLPRFHSFVGDAVLVAHNAAFDMKFLTLKQDALGIRFDQPVLDTVLLAAHLFQNTDSLTLDTLAERFAIDLPDEARHTALGDALATAGVMVSLMGLLNADGINTLGEALEVSEKQVALRRAQRAY